MCVRGWVSVCLGCVSVCEVSVGGSGKCVYG